MASEVIVETDAYTITRSISPAGFADTLTWKPGTTEANRGDLLARAQQAVKANDAYLATATPTNAQVVAQVARLTRECSALIKLLLDDLNDISGT